MNSKKLWYTKAASEWTQALPLGNGHMGAMCYGDASGRYDLSENTCWSGKEGITPLRENAAASMSQARQALLDRDYKRAEALLENCTGIKENYGTQVPMGRLTAGVEETPLRIYRELDLETGTASETLEFEEKTVTRESFLSNPDRIMGVRIRAQKGIPACCVWVEGWSQPSNTKWDPKGQTLTVHGRALENIHSDGLSGVSYSMLLHYETDGTVSWNRRGLVIEGASKVTVWLAAATDLFEKDPDAACLKQVQRALQKGWEAVRRDHLTEYQAGMKASSFSLPDVRANLPTDERIRAFAENGGDDGGLIALLFDYGRYLLFSSSRKDSALPAALQGVWNDDRACRMEWTDDMHLDVNTQMNYYPAENTGLGDCTAPLFGWIKNTLVPHGRKIAKQLYGKKGWCAHTVSNAYGFAAPGWDVGWGLTVSAGGWAAYQIWEHYLFTKDRAFLEEYFSVLYENAEFLAGILMEDPETGMLLPVPSYSPENSFLYEGERFCMTAGASGARGCVYGFLKRNFRKAAAPADRREGADHGMVFGLWGGLPGSQAYEPSAGAASVWADRSCKGQKTGESGARFAGSKAWGKRTGHRVRQLGGGAFDPVLCAAFGRGKGGRICKADDCLFEQGKYDDHPSGGNHLRDGRDL